MSIRDTADLAQKLRTAIEARGSVGIDTDDLASLDVAVLQLLVSAHRSAGEAGVALSIRVPREGVLARALSDSGIGASVDLPLLWDGDVWTGLGQLQGEAAA